MASSRPRQLLPLPSKLPASTPRPRVTKASHACTECQKRKAKCTGGVPCQRCSQSRLRCVVDKEGDGRRKSALGGRLEGLEKDRTLLLRLLSSIRDGRQNGSERLLSYIRSHASVDDIRQFLSQDLLSLDPDRTQPQVSHSPQYRVPAWPWTSLTNDSNYVSHLISLYFTWSHPLQRLIDRDLFIIDMQKGHLDSQFCSPFLVNAILAVACFYCSSSDHATGAVLPGSQQFYNEAKRLSDQNEGRVSLTSFQGRCELFLSAWAMGRSILAWQYSVDIIGCTRDLAAQRTAIAARADAKSQELLRALETAITGFFSAPPIQIPAFHLPFMAPKHPEDTPSLQDRDHDDLWHPYPAASGNMLVLESVPAHTSCISSRLFELQHMLWKIFNKQSKESLEQTYATRKELADTVRSRLTQWALNLPASFTYTALLNSNPTPAMLHLHIRHHGAIIEIYDGIADDDGPDRSTANKNKNTSQDIRMSSAQIICSLLDRFLSQWSAKYVSFTFVRYAQVALSTLLPGLDDTANRAAFINTYTTLSAISSRLPVANEIKKLIREQAKQLRTDLPPEISGPDS